ncbi:MAG TPA: ABC transporter transmembrane domain-containing protein, partial [Methylomirabilota bacterium]|nr:ABC transporter transmembrane domain-containing protein [Methylomirabilota bacterium]
MASAVDIELEEAFARRRMSRALLARLAGYLRPYRRAFALNIAFTLLATASQLLGPKFIQIGIDRHLAPVVAAVSASRHPTGSDAGPSVASPAAAESGRAPLRGLLVVSAIYLGNLVLGWGLSVAQVKSAIRVGQGAMNDLRLAVFEHIQRLSLSYFDRTHQGRIIARADTDIDSLDRIMTWGANQLLASALTLAGVVGLMLQYDWRLCVATSLVLPPLIVATRLFHRHGLSAYRKLRSQTSRLTA